MKRIAFTLATTAMFSGTAFAETTVLFEDFEDATVTYTGPADSLANIGARNYYGRVTSTVSGVSLSNIQGAGYYGAEDTDDAGTSLSTITLEFNTVDIAGLTDLAFSIFVAEDDDGSNEDWDADSSFIVTYQIDGGGYSNLFAIQAVNNTNTAPAVDTNFNGFGDGTEITDAFVKFDADILGTGNVLDLRITISGLDAGDEDIAFDNVTISGVPEPGSLALLGLGGLLIARRRRA